MECNGKIPSESESEIANDEITKKSLAHAQK
jgi:hypothetical protein